MEHDQHTDQARTVGGGARRRRPLLASLATLGVVSGLLGVAGVFAAGSDQATTGTNDAISGESGAEGDDVDLQLTTAEWSIVEGTPTQACDESGWTDDLASGVVTSGGLDLTQQGFIEGAFHDAGFLCIRNVGNATAYVTASTFDVVDVELACSPGEAPVDETCGSGVGELSTDLHSRFILDDCFGTFGESRSIQSLGESPVEVVTLPPDTSREVCAIVVGLEEDGPSDAAQSDQVSWRYRFDASAGGPPIVIPFPPDGPGGDRPPA